MANLKQCPNGHYYDPSIHPTCPYCSNASASVDRSAGMNYPPSVTNYDFATVNPDSGLGSTEPVGGGTSYGGGTVPPVMAAATTGPVSNAYMGAGYSYPNHKDGGTVPPMDYDNKTTIVKPVRSQDDGKAEDAKKDEPQKYVVGWLVAVEGPYCGQSFEIHHGNTYIGRSEGDIVLKKDDCISSSKNANTVYDERGNTFLLVAGQSTNLVYVNGKLLPSSAYTELKPYDKVELGKSKFLFVPFCSEQFQW